MDTDALEKKYNTMGVDLIQTHQLFCQEVLKLLPGEMAVISNGRVSNECGDSILLLGCFVLFYLHVFECFAPVSFLSHFLDISQHAYKAKYHILLLTLNCVNFYSLDIRPFERR